MWWQQKRNNLVFLGKLTLHWLRVVTFFYYFLFSGYFWGSSLRSISGLFLACCRLIAVSFPGDGFRMCGISWIEIAWNSHYVMKNPENRRNMSKRQVCSYAIETSVIASSTPLPPKLLVAGLICHRHFVVSQSATKKTIIHLRIAALPPPTDLSKGSEWFIINTQTDLRPEMHKKNIKRMFLTSQLPFTTDSVTHLQVVRR